MTDLSPAAQAVLDAAFDPWQSTDTPASIVAAALRAAADQAVPEMTTPWNSTLTPKVSPVGVRAQLLAIADELEARD